ncbi:hypothetical protein BDW62DRAFT_213128 [Aspergillus aurantiobrunneus]
MAALMNWARNALRRRPLPVLRLPTSGFETICPSVVLEEERLEWFKQGRYYPANIGDVFNSKYQIYVTLKIYTRDEGNHEGFQIYKQPSHGRSSHPGHARVMGALAMFTIPRHRFSEDLFKAGLIQVFLALDYLHSEYQKFVNGMPVYTSRWFDLPRVFGRAVLSDFGSAVRGDAKRNHDAQPNVYRSPENVWDLFEGKHLFYDNDPDGKGYSTRAQLAEVVGMLRPHGGWKQDIQIPTASLETSEEFLVSPFKELFLDFMRGMPQWRPENRKTAKDLQQDP